MSDTVGRRWRARAWRALIPLLMPLLFLMPTPSGARAQQTSPPGAGPAAPAPGAPAPVSPSPGADPRRSGLADLHPQTRAMQLDDGANPGMLSVLEGQTLWNQPPASRPGQQACAGCHGPVSAMRGLAARHPAIDPVSGRLATVEDRINACRVRHQQLPAFGWESRELLSLSALIAHQSRGLPIAPPPDERLAMHRERGRLRFEQKVGQLHFSCRDCHDTLAGRRLGASLIPQAHPTGYPLYRLEWQSLGSLQRRLRNCMTGVRAQPYAFGSIEHAELEAYLMWRARGLPIESPAVRP